MLAKEMLAIVNRYKATWTMSLLVVRRRELWGRTNSSYCGLLTGSRYHLFINNMNHLVFNNFQALTRFYYIASQFRATVVE